MKVLITLTLLGFSSLSFAEFKCTKTVDPKRVVLFVDTNDAPKEVDGAAKAACQRGETFKRIPSKSDTYINEKSLTIELTELAKQNIAVASMIVSGHDGGGSVHGIKGGVNKYEIIQALKTAYKSKPALLKEMKSVFMWGCWSMGPSEVEVWKTELPHLKLTAGFMDMGPLKTTEASHSVLNGLLLNEKALVAQSDAKKLKKAIQGIPNINVTLASVYTDAACGDMLYYQTQGGSDDYEAENPLFQSGTHFVDFDTNFSCKAMAPQIEQSRKQLMKYFYGSLPLPKDEPGSPIREIYAFLRNTAKCLPKGNHVLNADRIFLLRFYNEVKENFANTFKAEIGEANKEYVGLNDLMKYSTDEAKEMQAYIKKNKDKYFNPRLDSLKGKSRKEILDMISYLDGMVKLPMARDRRHAGKFNNLRKLRNAMDTYLFQLNPSCMNFMEWHEVQNFPPRARCDI